MLKKYKKAVIIFCGIIGLIIVLYYSYSIIFHVNISPSAKLPLCNHCNVILISLDTLGSNHLPCYGYDRNTAQNLCDFAQKNVLFTKSYSNAPWTLPSHFSIFTSLYPKHHGVENFYKDTLDASVVTLPQILQKNDYDTIYIGPTDNPSLPLDKGLGKGFSEIIKYLDIDTWQIGYESLIKNNREGKSTFLFLHTYWVHAPYFIGDLGGEKTKRLYTDKYYPQIPITYSQMYNSFSSGLYDYILHSQAMDEFVTDRKTLSQLKNSKNFSQAEKIFNSLSSSDQYVLRYNYYSYLLQENPDISAYAIDLYDELIYYLDQRLVTLFNLLKTPSIANNTIVIITSDHGEEFMEHGSINHPEDHIFNSTTATPLIMYIPGISNKKINNMVQSIDLLPTILGITGINKPSGIDGIDLTDMISGKERAAHNDYLISQGKNIDSIRDQRWKLYVHYNGLSNRDLNLYDLENDPDETHNFGINEKAKIIKDLESVLELTIYKRPL